MFSQRRQTVENVQTPAPPTGDRSVPDVVTEPPPQQMSRSNSLDSRLSSALSSSQLAESALVNLRKSLATQRSNSVSQSVKTPALSEGRVKSRLEDRLRAATSNALSGQQTKSPSPGGTEVIAPARPPSPPSIPLPNSPVTSPALLPVDASALGVPTPLELPSPSSISEQTQLEEAVFIEVSALNVGLAREEEEEEASITEPAQNTQNPANMSNSPHDSSPPPTYVTVDELQEKLKELEKRFVDVSASFKKLQAEKMAADLVLQEFSPVKSTQDSAGLCNYLQSVSMKTETLENELKRLNGKLEVQEDHFEELKNTHHLESASQCAQIGKLQTQLAEAEALIAAGQAVDAQTEAHAASRKAEVDGLHRELDRLQKLAKEEEEKRVKAISLLKTVRQKLVKAEKDREDSLAELAQLKEVDRIGKEQEGTEKANLRHEVEVTNRAKEKAIAEMRSQYERDVAHVKDRHDKELAMIRGQFDLELATIRSVHDHELSQKTSHISSLEHSLNNLTKDKNTFFDSLQLRQAELESAQSHLESLQSQNTELQYQLREVDDRCALLKEDLAELQREQDARSRDPAPSIDEFTRLFSASEAKYEGRISALKKRLDDWERERSDNEAEWSRKLQEKAKEVEELKLTIGSRASDHQQHEEVVANLRAELGRSDAERRLFQEQLIDLRKNAAEVTNTEQTRKIQELELTNRITALEQQIEETRQLEVKARLTNKTLREEMRKVQSSAALLERQRNPGIGGYWSPRPENDNPSSASPNLPSRPGSIDQGSPSDEVNIEYIRNVILQFLEHKEMRPNLVKVLSTILHFTPQETRRLIAKY